MFRSNTLNTPYHINLFTKYNNTGVHSVQSKFWAPIHSHLTIGLAIDRIEPYDQVDVLDYLQLKVNVTQD